MVLRMNTQIAQSAETLPGDINGIGPLGQAPGAVSTFARLLSSIIGLLTFIAFIFFAFTLIAGAIAVISAGGDKVKLADARSRLSTGVIGVVIAISSLFLLDLIARLLGISGILNIEEMIKLVSPPP